MLDLMHTRTLQLSNTIQFTIVLIGLNIFSIKIQKINFRWVTVHGTNNGRVVGNVGYITRGHGFFIEDGNERGTVFDGNLGMVTHQGIVLPTDKGGTLCLDAKEGYNGHTAELEKTIVTIVKFVIVIF